MTETREERFARKLSRGGGGSGVAMTRLLAEIEDATEEIRRMRDEGKSAKEMASSLKYVSVLTLLENLSGDDRRLANDAAKELLKAGTDAGPTTVVNVLNVDRGDLARRLAFLDQLKSRKPEIAESGAVAESSIITESDIIIKPDATADKEA